MNAGPTLLCSLKEYEKGNLAQRTAQQIKPNRHSMVALSLEYIDLT